MIPPKNFNQDHTARYLVLLSQDDATRALLFARDHRYLAEVIDDDGLVIDNLMKAGKACAMPHAVAAQTQTKTQREEPAELLCFAL